MQYADTESAAEDEVEDFSRIPKPGQLIRASRTQRNMTREELAEATRLNEAVLISVEADDYAALGQPVYARGYYRKCAEILGLNGEILVDAYEKRSGTGSPIPVIQQRPSIRYREGAGPAKFVSMLAMLLAVLAFGGWWLSQNPAALDDILSSQRDGQIAGTAATSGDVAGETALAATPRPRPVKTPAPTRAPTAPVEPAQARQIAATAAPVPRAEAQTKPEVKAVKAEPSPAPPPRLTVRVGSGQAWTSIQDHTGEQLLYKLLPPGSQREVSGELPFKVSLGRADNVRLWLNGRPLDFSSRIGADLRANFRILADGQVEG